MAESAPGPTGPAPVVIRISPMAHFAVGFLVLALLTVVLALPSTVVLLVIPLLLSFLVVRLRTVADADALTARGAFSSTTVPWEDVAGLRFEKGTWARADLISGGELRLPAVTFSTLPRLAEASGGRVPNPYA